MHYFIYIVSLVFFIREFFFRGPRIFSIIHSYLLFYLIQFGPHTIIYIHPLSSSLGRISHLNDSHSEYILLIAIFQFALTSFYLALNKGVQSAFSNIFKLKRVSFRHSKKFSLFLIVLTVVLVLISMILQASNRYSLVNLRFLIGSSFYSYVHIRRELFAGSSVSSFLALLRYTVGPFLITMSLVNMRVLPLKLRSINGLTRFILWGLITSLIFIFLQIQLNKLVYFYDGLVISVAAVVYLKNIKQVNVSDLFKAKNFTVVLCSSVIIFLATRLFFFAYTLQYRGVLATGQVAIEKVQRLVIYRAFYAAADATMMWIDYFSTHDFVGLAVNPKISALLNLDYFQAPVLIPQYYLGLSLTTFQPGAIGSGYAIFGLFGVIFVAFIIAIVISLSTGIQAAYLGSPYYSSVVSTLASSAYFLNSSDIFTALLSGGALLLPLIFLLVLKVFGTRESLIQQPPFVVRT